MMVVGLIFVGFSYEGFGGSCPSEFLGGVGGVVKGMIEQEERGGGKISRWTDEGRLGE